MPRSCCILCMWIPIILFPICFHVLHFVGKKYAINRAFQWNAFWKRSVLCHSTKDPDNAHFGYIYIYSCSFYSAPHCKRCTSYGNSVRPSVCPSVTRRYCVKTTVRSTVQFALLNSKICLVLYKPKNIPQGRPLPPEILARSDLPSPDSSESWHILPCSASTVRYSNAAKTRNQLKFAGVPQTNETISAASGPKFTILWEHVEEILLLNRFFSDCRYMP